MRMGEYPVDSKVRIGKSKISGTVKGTVNAGIGILSMIADYAGTAGWLAHLSSAAEAPGAWTWAETPPR